ncbi:MAG: antitoxin Xre/MbcA/ParS toxin-binding domain-containing protein [Longimicrobiales bacterium]
MTGGSKRTQGRRAKKPRERQATLASLIEAARGAPASVREPKAVYTRAPIMVELGSLSRVPGPEGREAVRQVVEQGLPVDLVRQLQDELVRLGVPRPSKYVEVIASRAARARRKKLTPQEGERLVRVAGTLARAFEVWGDEEDAAEFLTAPHPGLEGDTPIDRARSEIGARQVEDLLLKLDLGLPA